MTIPEDLQKSSIVWLYHFNLSVLLKLRLSTLISKSKKKRAGHFCMNLYDAICDLVFESFS